MNHPELVHGLELLPCAIRDGMLYIPHADGNWVSAAKLQPFSLAIIKCWREEQSRVAPVAQAAVGADSVLLRYLLEHCMVEDENGALAIRWSSSREPRHHPMPERLEWIRGDLEGEAKRVGLSPRPEADADRASGGGV